MKRILTCLLFLVSGSAIVAQEEINYKDFEYDEPPTDEYASRVALMSGLKGSYAGAVSVEAVLANKMAVPANAYLKKSAEVCNKLNWAPEMISDGYEITPGNIRWWWENGENAIVTLDWAINSGERNGSIVPYLEFKTNKLHRQLCRIFKFKDGSVLVMLKVGRVSCGNMFLRLLRTAPTVPVEKKGTDISSQKKSEERTILSSPKQEERIVLTNPSREGTPVFNPTNWNFRQTYYSGGIVIKQKSPIVVGGGDPGGGGNPGVGGGDPGGRSISISGGNPGN